MKPEKNFPKKTSIPLFEIVRKPLGRVILALGIHEGPAEILDDVADLQRVAAARQDIGDNRLDLIGQPKLGNRHRRRSVARTHIVEAPRVIPSEYGVD